MPMQSSIARHEDPQNHEWHYTGWFEHAKALQRWGRSLREKNMKAAERD